MRAAEMSSLHLAAEQWAEAPLRGSPAVGSRPEWFVLRVEPNKEARTHRRLTLAGHLVYAPFYQRSVRQNYLRRRLVTRPLFPGYLFLAIDRGVLSERYRSIRDTPGVIGLLRAEGERWVTLANIHIKAFRDTERRLDAEAQGKRGRKRVGVLPFKVGDTVELDGGPLAGHLGKIESLDDRGRIGLLISLFGRLTPMEVSVNQVRVV